jgi:alpha-beta hydrolase superfamily lysophospholipase
MVFMNFGLGIWTCLLKISKLSEYNLNTLRVNAFNTRSIVAVHGLGGHALRTWTHPKTQLCWVRDDLPYRFRSARIFVFGYNAKKAGNGAELDFQDVAGQLATGLLRHRTTKEEKTRPIIFMAHSLGGLTVKKVCPLRHKCLSEQEG